MNEKIVVLGDVLLSPSNNTGWLFLEPPPWTSKSQGIFVVFDKDADPDDDPVPPWIYERGWVETLDVATIEDIVFNASAQINNPTIEQLVLAFNFYFENDAFMTF